MRLCRFGEDALGVVEGEVVRDVTAALDALPAYRYPLPAHDVRRIAQRLSEMDFDAIHSAFWDRGDIYTDAKAAIDRSVARHVNGPAA